MITEGEINRALGHHSRGRDIAKLNDHVIICGYGRVGRMLAQQLSAGCMPLVIVDRKPDRVEEALGDGFLAFCGDGVDDESLVVAGIARANSLATVLPDDAVNVFITLTARDLNDDIHIIARAECPSTERKLLRSGADRVVMPAAISATRMAQLLQSHEETSFDCDETVEDRLLQDIRAISNSRGSGSAQATRSTETQPCETIAD